MTVKNLVAFVVRHKAKGNLLPIGKGMSWWEGDAIGAVTPPRLFHSYLGAKNFIASWARGTVEVKRAYRHYELDDFEGELKITPKGRKKEMLEILPVTLTFGEPL